MELWTALGVAVALAAVIILFFVLGRRMAPRLDERVVLGQAGLPVIQTRRCEECRYFNLRAGQEMMRVNPSFFAATRALMPWQMGRKQEIEYNPEYLKLEKKLEKAIKDNAYQLQSELTEQMLKMDPGRVKKPDEYVPPEMLGVTWEDFGACAHHQELRARADSCEDFAPKLESVKEAS